MQRISRAPVLSATRRRVSAWITRWPPSGPRARGGAKTELAKDAGRDRCMNASTRPRTQVQRWFAASSAGAGVGRRSSGPLHDLHEPPPLPATDRSRLDHPDHVPLVRVVALVVRV